MLQISQKDKQVNPHPSDLLQLNQTESDMFMDIFALDFIKVINALKNKQTINESNDKRKPAQKAPVLDLEFLILSGQDIKKHLELLQLDRSQVWLTIDDFMTIDFGMRINEQFALINDILQILTGI